MNSKLAKVGAVLAGVAAPVVAFAQATDNPFNRAQTQINTIGNKSGIASGKTLPEIVGSLVNVALGFVGILLLVYLLYAGFLWMTAGGDEKQTEKATAYIKNAVIGLVIVISSYAISSFVLGSLVNVGR